MRKLMMLRFVSIMVELVTLTLCADTITIDGYSWPYEIQSNGVSIGGTTSDGLHWVSATKPQPKGDITIPSMVEGMPVIGIRYSALAYCRGLTSVVIPESIGTIGQSAFEGCTSLDSVVLPENLIQISVYAFRNCGLKSIEIPIRCRVSGGAFENCGKLRKITSPMNKENYNQLPNSCFPVDAVTNIVISYGTTNIFSSALAGFTNLVSLTMPEGVDNISANAFLGCTKLEGVILPDTVTNIDSMAFGNCSSLKSVLIPESVVSVADKAFGNCSSLKSVLIPESVVSVADNVFTGCTNIEDITMYPLPSGTIATLLGTTKSLRSAALMRHQAGRGVERYVGSGSSYNSDGGFFSGCSKLTDVTLPEGVSRIGAYCFNGCSSLVTIVLPSSVKRIMPRAFYGCSGLTELTVPNSVTNIGSSAFYGCTSLRSFIIPDKVENVYANAFNGCSNLVNVTIPNSVTNIGAAAFSGCSSLKNLVIPNKMENIYANTFSGCSNLESIVIPNGVTNIQTTAFTGCRRLRKATIPQAVCSTNMVAMFPDAYQSITNIEIADGTTTISRGCFSGCESLESITIPASVTRIDARAFESCINLKSVRFLGEAPDPDDSIYYGTSRSLVTYVPQGSKGWGGGVSDKLPESWPVGDATARAIAYWDGPDENVTRTPVIVPYGGTLFTNSCEVSISCATEGATIYYTTNGSTPRASARYAYSSPFRVSDTTTIKAVAVADGLENSDYVTVVLKKVDAFTLPLALGTPIGVNITTSEGAEWFPTGDYASPTNGLASRSGQIPAESETWIDAVINGAGTFTFWWRVSCEEDPDGTCSWDHLSCDVDGEHYASIDGITGWERRDIVFDEAKEHSVRWTFAKDDFDEDEAGYEDCAWLAGLSWKPTAVLVPSSMTGGRSIVVEKTWSERYPLFDSLYGPDFAAAVTNTTGKFSSAGEPMFVWHDYLMGTDPTDIDDRLLAHITFRRRQPAISWTPNLNTNGEVRVYKVFGKTNLTDSAWSYPKNNGHRFFKVKVEMP